ncbi:MAG: NosD domain-containing protein [Candidatus Bathyarchaeota archaeon]|nr:NosD domain-containing protein [Candidatus Bathyarchaeum tardum]
MNKIKLFFSVFLISLLVLASIPKIRVVKAQGNTIYIKADGTVEGTDKIERTGIFYSFTGNVSGSISVERDNIVIDGAGYTLSANSGYGIKLHYRHYVTVKNLVIKDTYRGIDLTYADDNNIFGNTIINSEKAVYFWWSWRNNVTGNTVSQASYAFEFYQSPNYWCQENVVAKNTVYDSLIGLSLMESNNTFSDNIINSIAIGVSLRGNQNLFRNNTINCTGIAFKAYSFDNDIDTSNLVNGKPIIYWMGHRDETVPSDAGYVVLSNCNNITAQNLNAIGVSMFSTTNSLIAGNTLSGGQFGIQMIKSSNNTITGNSMVKNEFGLELTACNDNTIVANNISSNSYYGMLLTNSHYNIMNQNSVANNGFGKEENYYHFPYEDYSLDYFGVKLLHACNNFFVENNVTRNNEWGIRLLGDQHDNVIYHNNFIDNGAGDKIQVSMIPPSRDALVANPSSWDNGTRGNYWSDYFIRYPNASEIGNTGIGDTPFYINENNIDHYPLMKPCDIPEFSSWIILPLFISVTLTMLFVRNKIQRKD